MAKSEFTLAFNEITETHHLPREVVIDALRQALVSAYRRDMGVGSAQRIEADIDPMTNRFRILVEKEVADSVEDTRTEVTLDEALKIDPNTQIGETLMVPEETLNRPFGRIAAQTAKQVILQKIREAERKSLYDEYKDREGDLVTGQVQSVSGQNITLSLGRAEAIMPTNQQIKGERYRPHDKIRTFVLEVKETNRGPQIIVSRAHKNMLRRLLEYEVPEIYNGQVEIKNIAREAGHRSKVAVSALQPGVDPVGACVGMRGMRIQNIVKELNDEKIDVIEWNADSALFIAKALSPARVTGVYLEEDIDQGHTATVIVPDDQLSLAIGKEGQNARLAAKLTGWRIDIKSVSEAAFDAHGHLAEPPLSKMTEDHPDLVAEVTRILDKKRADRAVMPEEYQTLTRFVQLAEQRMLEQREASRLKRRKAMEKARPNVPASAFKMELEELELARDIVQAVKNKNILNVGELMLRLQAEEETLRTMLEASNAGDDAMDAIKEAIDSLVIARQAALAEEAPEEAALVEAAPAIPEVAAVAVAAPVAEEGVSDEEAPPAFVDEEPAPVLVAEAPKAKAGRRIVVEEPEPEEEVGAFQAEPSVDEEGGFDKKKKGKKAKQKSRELVFDEKRGEVVVKRKRKGGRGRGWQDFEE